MPGTLEHLLVVDHGLEALSHLLELVDLLSDEGLLLCDLLLDLFKEHVHCLFLKPCEDVQSFQKSFLVFRLSNLHIKMLAFLQDMPKSIKMRK